VPVAEKPSKQKKAKINTAEQVAVKEVVETVVEVEKKKKKKAVAEEIVEPIVTEKQKKKKKQVTIDEEPEQPTKAKKLKISDETTEPIQKPKKKRKAEEPIEEVEKEVSNKKLKALRILEEPIQRSLSLPEMNVKAQESTFAAPLASQKLKRVLPQKLEIEKKKRKKAAKKRVIPEPQVTPPRSVWQPTSGFWFEEPRSPFKFNPTSYVPINAGAGGSTKFGVFRFENQQQKKKPTQMAPTKSFQEQMMERTAKLRDGSKKNIQGLLKKTKTFH
jgi:post-segregation antitoxin (ccd killing protein)